MLMQQLADAVFLWKEHDDPRGLERLVCPVETVLNDIPRIVIKDGAVSALSHGAPLAGPESSQSRRTTSWFVSLDL